MRSVRIFLVLYEVLCGPGSSVGIATGYGLDGPGIESRCWARFSAHVQTGPGAHPASCTMGTGSFPEVKSGRGVTLTPHPILVPWSRKYRVIPKSLRDFRPLRYSSQDGHAEGEHVNRGRDTPSFCPTLQVLDMSTLGDAADSIL